MTTRFIFYLWALMISPLCFAQYSISGYLDAPETPKRVYLSLLEFNEQMTMSKRQIISSTLTDSLGYFNFEGQLLSQTHALYRIHANIDESSKGVDFADVEEFKNFHNFIFSNQDTIVFQKNKTYWFSSNNNTNPVDQEWQDFDHYVINLRKELAAATNLELQQQSSSQILSELKSYANTKKTHPLATLLLLNNVKPSTLKEDFLEYPEYYSDLQEQLDSYYNESGYAQQFKLLLVDISKTKTQTDLDYYKWVSYGLTVLCVLLIGLVVVLGLQLKQRKTQELLQLNSKLTKQEEKVAELMCQDKSNKEIAAELFVSLSTVKTHIRNIYGKLEVNNRAQLTSKFKNQPRD